MDIDRILQTHSEALQELRNGPGKEISESSRKALAETLESAKAYWADLHWLQSSLKLDEKHPERLK